MSSKQTRAQQNRIKKKNARKVRKAPTAGKSPKSTMHAALADGNYVEHALAQIKNGGGKHAPLTKNDVKKIIDETIRQVVLTQSFLEVYEDALDEDVIDIKPDPEALRTVDEKLVLAFEDVNGLLKLLSADIPVEDMTDLYIHLLTTSFELFGTDIPVIYEPLTEWGYKLDKHRSDMIDRFTLSGEYDSEAMPNPDLFLQQRRMRKTYPLYATKTPTTEVNE